MINNPFAFPLRDEFKNYNISFFRADFFAALSVALLALPQAMAYAFLADLPIAAGIFSAIFGTIFTGALGSSRWLISGPTNTVAILIQSGASEILYTYYRGIDGPMRDALAMQIVLQLSLVVGIIQIVGGALNWGRVTQFASRPVVVGYTLGVAVAIIVSQLFYFFGIPRGERALPLYQEGFFLFCQIKNMHPITTLFGVVSLFLLVLFQSVSQKIPAALIVMALSGALVYAFNLSPNCLPGQIDLHEGEICQKVTLLQDVGPLPAAIPHFHFPFFNFRILTKLMPLAVAIALLSVLEVTAIARSYAKERETLYSDSGQVLGLGLSNFFTSFFGGMPSSGSFSRTSLNKSSGAKTRLSPIMSGLFVLLFLGLFQSVVMKIPLTSLSALMLLTALTMVNRKDFFVCVRATPTDALVLLVTFIASLLFTLDVALYTGVALSIALYLKQASTPSFSEYTFTPKGKLRKMEENDDRPDPEIAILQADGSLFFGSIDLFQTKLRQVVQDENIKIVILQVLNTDYIDASACLALKQLNEYLRNAGCELLIAGVSGNMEKVLRVSGVIESIGEDHFFPGDVHKPSLPTREAYTFAKTLKKASFTS